VAPSDLGNCQSQEGCYWRWLVHTLLDDVNGLKDSLDKAQADLNTRSEQRRKLEQTQEHQGSMQEESRKLRAALESLRDEVPRLRKERDHLKSLRGDLQAKRRDLEERKCTLLETIKGNKHKFAALEDEVVAKERFAQQKLQEEQSVKSEIKAYQEELEKTSVNFDFLTTERNKMRKEVEALESKKKAKKGAKAKAKAK